MDDENKIIAVVLENKDKKPEKNNSKPKKQYLFMYVGFALGLAAGSAFDQSVIGMCIGLAVGALIDEANIRGKK